MKNFKFAVTLILGTITFSGLQALKYGYSYTQKKPVLCTDFCAKDWVDCLNEDKGRSYDLECNKKYESCKQECKIKKLSKKELRDIDILNFLGAAIDGNVNVIKNLLEKYSNDPDFVNSISPYYGPDNKSTKDETALMWAVMLGKKDIVQALIDANADVNASDHSGRTPLMYATYKYSMSGGDMDYVAQAEIVKALINAGADVNATDNNGRSVLMYAKKDPKEMKAIITILENAGATASAD